MKTREEISEYVKGVVVKQFELDLKGSPYDPDEDFSTNLGADELDIVELIMTFEEDLNIEITDANMEKLTTPNKVIDFALNALMAKA